MGERDEPIDCGDKGLAGQKLGKGSGAVERSHAVRCDEPVPAAPARDQHAAFLERFADRGDLERPERVRKLWGAVIDRAAALSERSELRIRRLHSPARKDQRAGGEVDLMMAHDHEGLEPARPVPQEEHGRGGAGRGDFGHSRARSMSLSLKRWILPVAVFGNSAMNSIARGYL